MEISNCDPPYDDFNNKWCYDLLKNFGSDIEAPMILKCYIGLIPFYCPWDLPYKQFSIVEQFKGYR